MSSKISFRAATLSDKEAVQSIHEGLYLDSMQVRFDAYANNSYRFSFLAEDTSRDSLVVSFLGLKVMDEGRTAYYYGARTHESYNGLGIQTNLLEYALSTVRKSYPNINVIRYGSENMKYTDEYFKQRKDKELLIRKNFVAISMKTKFCRENIEEWQRHLSHVDEDIRKIEPSQIVDYIEEESLQSVLDKGFLVYDFYCCDARAYNDEAFTELITGAFIGIKNDVNPTSLSTRCVSTHKRPKYNINISALNIDITLRHIFHHLKEIVEFNHDELVEVFLHFNQTTDFKALRNYLESTGGFEDGLTSRELCYTNIIQLMI